MAQTGDTIVWLSTIDKTIYYILNCFLPVLSVLMAQLICFNLGAEKPFLIT